MSYTNMYRAIEVLWLMVPGRRRVLSCHSRAIGQKSSNFLLLARYQCLYISVYEIWNAIWNEWEFETGRKMFSSVCVD